MADQPMRSISPEPLTADAWLPFGWLPAPDTAATDGEHTLAFAWGDAHLNTIEHRTDEVEETPRGFRCSVMYRHDTHTQMLTPLDAHVVLAVAPAAVGFATADDLETIRAFVLVPGETIVLHRGTWHWGPFPIGGATTVRLLNLQGLRYREDNADADLGPFGVEIRTP